MEGIRGINYEVGLKFHPEHKVDYEVIGKNIEADLEDIKEMGCNAVRVYGDNIENLLFASKTALDKGLDVWLSPRLVNADEEQTVEFLHDIAVQAEELRIKYGDHITFVVGNELTLDSKVVFAEENYAERISKFGKFKALELARKYAGVLRHLMPSNKSEQEKIRSFVKRLALETKEVYHGPITYASLPDEDIDWEHFDIVGTNLYKDGSNNGSAYPKELYQYKRHGKPVAITEFGTAPFKGAGMLGGFAHSVIDWNKGKLKPAFGLMPAFRDEVAQANYLEHLIDIYEKHQIDAHFLFEYTNWNTIHNSEDSKRNLTTGSFGLVHRDQDGNKVKNLAFERLKQRYTNGS